MDELEVSPTLIGEREQPLAPSLSVLVRCRNERTALPFFWNLLRLQTVFAQIEVVVLDSGSTDGSVEYMLSQPCRVFAIDPSTFNFGRSCNQLMRLSRAPRAMFLSAHVFLQQPDTLSRLVDLLDPTQAQAVYLRQVPNPTLGFSAYEAAYLKRRFPVGGQGQLLDRPGGFSNAASALTYRAWQDLAFPEIHGSEDFEWAKMHLARGGELSYLPYLLAQHSHNETPEQVYERVRLNVLARGAAPSYGTALRLLVGVAVQTMREGANVRTAMRYAISHARAYL